jgi:DNA-binding response OmpR family regulator
MPVDKPRVMIAIEDKDAMASIAGVLWFKGYEVYKSNSAEECMSKINELKDRNMHVVIVSQQVALDSRAMLIVKVKRSNIDTKVLVLADEDNEKTKILDYGADEFTLKPISPENVADKLFMLLTREVVSENK